MTTTVLQARCPHCKRELRLPAEWVHKAMRCKHCQGLIQARPRGWVPPAPAPERVVARVTPPAPVAPPPLLAAPAMVPPAAITTAPEPVPLELPTLDEIPAAPSAQAMTTEPAPYLEPFGEVDTGNDLPPLTIRRPRHGSPVAMLVVSVVLLACAGGAAFLAVKMWPDGKPPGLASGTETSPTTGPTGVVPPATGGSVAFPRRAMIISVHNYLFANPTNFGQPGVSSRNLDTFQGRLSHRGSFAISPSQIGHLSDAARKNRTAPTRPVIEKTIEEFLDSSRSQDRIVLVFVGHGVEIEEKAYLVPIEGELDKADTLIPLSWVYEKLAACKARQKVLILDVCRFSPSRGQERPGGDPMTEKFDEALKTPPPGVQVWSACVAGQQSLEFELDPIDNGLFMDCLQRATGEGIQGKIQKPTDPFPLEQLVAMVNDRMKEELEPLKLKQTSRLSGTEADSGADYNPSEEAPGKPSVAAAPKLEGGQVDRKVVAQLLKEVQLPPIKPAREEGQMLPADALPPFDARVLDQYPQDNSETPVRKAIHDARVLLWAVSNSAAPEDLRDAVRALRQKEGLAVDLSVLKDSYLAPTDENAFKMQVARDSAQTTRIHRLLEEGLAEMEKVKEEHRDKAPKRWQVHFDFVFARLQAQLAYIWEYESAVGRMRGELPPRDPKVHRGWRLASQSRLVGDAAGKRLAREASKSLDTLAEENAKTPWAVLAKRERLTALGLEWQPEK